MTSVGWAARWTAAVLLLTTHSSLVHVHAQGPGAEDMPNFSSMRVKQLRALLKERGVSADGVMEKADLVTLASESFHLPILQVPKEEVEAAEAATETAKGRMDDSQLDEIMRKLQRETGQGFRVFKPGDDLDDFLASEGIKQSKKSAKTKNAAGADEL